MSKSIELPQKNYASEFVNYILCLLLLSLKPEAPWRSAAQPIDHSVITNLVSFLHFLRGQIIIKLLLEGKVKNKELCYLSEYGQRTFQFLESPIILPELCLPINHHVISCK